MWQKIGASTALIEQFQSTHLHEVWLRRDSLGGTVTKFQSTHLHEVWPPVVALSSKVKGFNPHTYMRCDCHWNTYTFVILVSIHTPTWGVTLVLRHLAVDRGVSIHTPTWGVTFHPIKDYLNERVSIHTPTWGVTSCPGCGRTLYGFNPHTYMRCDIIWK